MDTLTKSLIGICIILSGCAGSSSKEGNVQSQKGSFGYDLTFLKKHDSIIVLSNQEGKAQVIVSPKYQGKVFTSTAEGEEGKSFGWVNYEAFDATPDPHMNAYGGENRFWLGPEGGPFSLFFKKGAPMKFDDWKTPGPIDTEAWSVTTKNSRSVELEKNMVIPNYAGTQLRISASRTVTILDENNIATIIGGGIHPSVKCVGYATANTIKNNGQEEWTEKNGMPCIWILDMFPPSDKTIIILPFDSSKSEQSIITTNYFGEIPSDRIKVDNGLLFFKADGKHRSKLGIKPSHARNVAGSFDAVSNSLTVIYFDVDRTAKYLNQEWNTTKPAFSGDAVNAYNDGPLENGNQLGPFYELESVSPAAFLRPGASFTHHHTVLHFTGDNAELNKIAVHIFGISLDQIEHALR